MVNGNDTLTVATNPSMIVNVDHGDGPLTQTWHVEVHQWGFNRKITYNVGPALDSVQLVNITTISRLGLW